MKSNNIMQLDNTMNSMKKKYVVPVTEIYSVDADKAILESISVVNEYADEKKSMNAKASSIWDTEW